MGVTSVSDFDGAYRGRYFANGDDKTERRENGDAFYAFPWKKNGNRENHALSIVALYRSGFGRRCRHFRTGRFSFYWPTGKTRAVNGRNNLRRKVVTDHT